MTEITDTGKSADATSTVADQSTGNSDTTSAIDDGLDSKAGKTQDPGHLPAGNEVTSAVDDGISTDPADKRAPERLDPVKDAEQINSMTAELRARELAHADESHTVSEHIDATTEQLDRRVLTGENARGVVQLRAPENATRWESDASAVIASDYLRQTPKYDAERQKAETQGTGAFAVRQPLRDALGPDWRDQVSGRTVSADGTSTEASSWHEDSQAFGLWRQQSDGQWHLYSCYPEPKLAPRR